MRNVVITYLYGEFVYFFIYIVLFNPLKFTCNSYKGFSNNVTFCFLHLNIKLKKWDGF